MEKFKITLTIILAVLFTLIMLLVSEQLKTTKLFSISQNEYINYQFNYQVLILLIAFISLVVSYILNPINFLNFFEFGSISAQAKELKLFGISNNDSWLKTGISLTIFISLSTATFMYFQIKQQHLNWDLLKSGLFWILIFSFTNSFSEEMIFRMGIVSPLKGLLQPNTIFIISAILFGIPHFMGMPSGLIGATMAGVLGFVLAKSLFETNGFFWAWIIHFFQDVIIIGVLFLNSTKF